jgi:hypothetical protein
VQHSLDDQLPSLDVRLALQEPQLTIDHGGEACHTVHNRFGNLGYNGGVFIFVSGVERGARVQRRAQHAGNSTVSAHHRDLDAPQ